ncbi:MULTISPECIES: 4'-phosphopantetheinyl transferase superfamily protein [unclassified Moritella]|uniref:4'-phosphopantetheinyl transferase family protein n=1 Tax=unclassified Moritella TaxID=2637987 RepID=UPI001BA75B4F|nr:MULTISPECIES: 4'-phosphopantetheinyl transferase superfamily protein [unclassified Moritella]QUM83914.1 4'-phosphopantetheinyl transferase superfamily protein [Moritella sp. 28]QUM88223.1 4'-phosphopantetheinyl transferase superfamily protein [Moritella sp. 36]
MPHTESFFSPQLTFTSNADLTTNINSTIEAYLFNSNTISSEQITSFSEHYLHPHEYEVFTKRKQQQAQQEYLATRIIIKAYASQCLGYNFTELYVLFDTEKNDLNIYYNEDIVPLKCCISHSHGQVLIALAPTTQPIKLGVDLEWISTKRSLERIAHHYYHAEELAACTAQSLMLKAQAFYRIWTLKEALAKAIKQPIAALLRDNVFNHCEQLHVRSGCYGEFDLSIISDLEFTDNTYIKILTGVLDQDFRNVK